MESDEGVLEYYDQPKRLQLRYRAHSGRNTTQWHTPDFLIRKSSAGLKSGRKHQPLKVSRERCKNAMSAVLLAVGSATKKAVEISR